MARQALELLHLETFGAKDNPQIILLHGIATNSRMWSELVELLRQDFFIVSLDLLGHGNSPKPDTVSYSAITQVEYIHRTLQYHKLLTPSIVVGFSIGALIGAHLAKHHPELVESLSLVAPPVYFSPSTTPSLTVERIYDGVYDLIRRLPQTITLRFLKVIKKITPSLIGNNEFNKHTWYPIISSIEHTVQRQAFAGDLLAISEKILINVYYGTLDHLVIKTYLKEITTRHANIYLQKITAPHAFTQNYQSAIWQSLLSARSTQEA